MAQDINVPDIGDFKDVEVIDVLVKPGDEIAAETPLITLETEKATMDVPSSAAGVVRSVAVKKGDRVSKGSLILTLEADLGSRTADAQKAEPGRPASPPSSAASADRPGPAARVEATASAASSAIGHPPSACSYDFDMVVLGGGPGGYTEAFRAADLGMKTALIERWPQLGGVCLNVGCIPSKALLHAAKVIDDAAEMAHAGVTFGAPAIDASKLRDWKNTIVARLTGGLATMAKQRKVEVIRGVGKFASPHEIDVFESRI
ncbi:MAG TPA: biotin/lipoyl-containing protein, partial [Steroidobacter sp.]|nr:biotin/lipoyl-containing protein [Steroidobacter sp.]